MRNYRVMAAVGIVTLTAVLVAILFRPANSPSAAQGSTQSAARNVVQHSGTVDVARTSAEVALPSARSAPPEAITPIAYPVVVRAVDDRGRALAGVEVSARNAGVPTSAAATDADGTVTLAIPRVPEAKVIGVYRGKWRGESRVAEGQQEVELVIETGGSLSGVLTTDRGGVAAENTVVIAWSNDSPRSGLELARAALHGDEDVPVAWTDASGRFELLGLDRDRVYQLTAGGSGWTHEKPLRGLKPDGPQVELELTRVFVLVAQFFDSTTDEPVRVAESWWPWGAIMPRVETSATRQFVFGPGVVLAGLPEEFGAGSLGPGRAVVVLATQPNLDVAGPIRLHVQLPGYLPVDVSLSAAPLERGVSLERIHLDPIASGWGSIRLALTSDDAQPEPDWSDVSNATSLRLRGDSGLDLRFGVNVSPGREVLIDDVPFGEYTASLEISWGLTSLSPVRGPTVTMGSTPTRLEFELTGAGSIQLEIRDRDGRPVTGSATVAVAAPGAGFGMPLVFREAPHVLHGLVSGEYRLRLMAPFVSPMDGVPVLVKSGERATVEFRRP